MVIITHQVLETILSHLNLFTACYMYILEKHHGNELKYKKIAYNDSVWTCIHIHTRKTRKLRAFCIFTIFPQIYVLIRLNRKAVVFLISLSSRNWEIYSSDSFKNLEEAILLIKPRRNCSGQIWGQALTNEQPIGPNDFLQSTD